MTSDWYFAKAGAQAGSEAGPFAWEQLYQLAKSGTIQPNDLVWNPKLPRGVKASLVPGLFLGLDTPTTPVQQVWVDEPPEPPAPSPPPSPPIETPAPTATTSPLEIPQGAPAEEQILATAKPQPSAPRRAKQLVGSKPDGQSNRLPLLVVLLTFIIAASGVAAYFLYFRV